jgi:uncharacterized protein (DUF4415 family)
MRQPWRLQSNVMTAKSINIRHRKKQRRRGKIARLQASVEDDLQFLPDEKTGAETRWNRPRKLQVSLRMDAEVVDWFKSKGPGYQTRINRILRKVMVEGKKRSGAI